MPTITASCLACCTLTASKWLPSVVRGAKILSTKDKTTVSMDTSANKLHTFTATLLKLVVFTFWLSSMLALLFSLSLCSPCYPSFRSPLCPFVNLFANLSFFLCLVSLFHNISLSSLCSSLPSSRLFRTTRHFLLPQHSRWQYQ